MAHKKHYASQSRTLYVVLQGEFALYHQVTEDPVCDRLRILAPDMDDHEYKAGPWLTDWKNARELPRMMSLRHAFGDHKDQAAHCSRSIPEENADIFVKLGRRRPLPERGAAGHHGADATGYIAGIDRNDAFGLHRSDGRKWGLRLSSRPGQADCDSYPRL